jgi:hypothetical protein
MTRATLKTVKPRSEASILMYAPDPFVNIKIMQSFAEGYPFDDFFVIGIKQADLQALADWLLVAPPEIYKPLETLSRKLESFLLNESNKR